MHAISLVASSKSPKVKSRAFNELECKYLMDRRLIQISRRYS
jgi:hypothetical protein